MTEQSPTRHPEAVKSVPQLVIEASQTHESLKGDRLAQALVNLAFLQQVTQNPDFIRNQSHHGKDIRITGKLYVRAYPGTLPIIPDNDRIIVDPEGQIRYTCPFGGNREVLTAKKLVGDLNSHNKGLVKKLAKMKPGQILDKISSQIR